MDERFCRYEVLQKSCESERKRSKFNKTKVVYLYRYIQQIATPSQCKSTTTALDYPTPPPSTCLPLITSRTKDLPKSAENHLKINPYHQFSNRSIIDQISSDIEEELKISLCVLRIRDFIQKSHLMYINSVRNISVRYQSC